jgi:hypothetical protein
MAAEAGQLPGDAFVRRMAALRDRERVNLDDVLTVRRLAGRKSIQRYDIEREIIPYCG